MAGIQSLGVGSGLLTSDLVDQLVSAERAASDLRLDAKTARVEAKISAYGEVRTVLDGLQSSIGSLALASTIQSSSATSSNESVLTASTNSTAEPGSYRIEVDEVAKAHSLASKQFSSVDDTIGTGTLTFKFGTTTYDGSDNYLSFAQDSDTSSTAISITSENNTLGGIRDAINNEDFGVNASVVYDGSGYRLLLTSEETGEETSMEIAVSGDAGLQALAYNGSQNDPLSNMEETQMGEDAQVRINGLSVTSSTNTLDQVVKGVSIDLTESSDSAVTLKVSRDVDDIADKLESFAEKYNEYKSVYDELTKYNPTDEIGGILLGDNVLRTVQTQLRSGITDIISGVTGSTYSSLIEIGLSTDQNDNFNLKFDRAAFTKAMDEDASSIVGLLATDSQATDAQVKLINSGPNTKPGSYDVSVTQVATQGAYQGLTATALDFTADVVISDINDEFSMTVDGKTKTVTLEQGSFSDGEDLALMLQNSMNSAFVGQSVTVTFDDTNDRFDIVSSKFGSSSEVSMGSGDPLVANTLGFASAGQGVWYGSSYTTLSEAAFAASTSPGTQALVAEDGVDFSTNTVSFDVLINDAGHPDDGIVKSITLNEDWANVLDTDGNVVTARDRSDVLTYIQSELNSAFSLPNTVIAEFNSSDRLVFRTAPDTDPQTLVILNTNVTGVDYLGITDGNVNSGLSVSSASFDLEYTHRGQTVSTASPITVPDGIYQTGDELAGVIENLINTDVNIDAGKQGAITEKGSRDLSAVIDFTLDPAEFVFELNGSEHTVRVNSTPSIGDNLANIQSAIDSEIGANQVTASLSSNGLVLTTNALGSANSLEIKRDGIGATTTVGGESLAVGQDFSLTPASFTLQVDGIDIEVTVDGDGTTGSSDADSNLSVIQQALDTGLAAAEGGGEFSAGDVVAKLDASNQLYFETVAKNGVQTEATFGADASIAITAVDGSATSELGLALGGPNINGFDGFGLDKGLYTGFDSQATVNYVAEGDRGRFEITFENNTSIDTSNVSTNSVMQLGISLFNQTDDMGSKGVDVEGTINGIEASGRGQYLTAAEGNSAATNGYLLGGTGSDFSSAELIDGTNNTLKVVIDGTESGTITLTAGAYASGDAMASELKSQINADSELQGASKSVDVQFDSATNTFGIFSVTKGAESSVRVSEITSGGIDIFGFTTSTQGVAGKDTEGSVDDAAGMTLKVTGTRTGDRGSITYVEGIMKKLDDIFDRMLSSSGLLTEKENNLSDDQEAIEEERAEVDERVSVFETRLRAKFLYNDKLISSLKTTEDFLTRQFDAMNASKDN